MINIRHFTEEDAAIIQQKQYQDIPITEIRKMISEWETNTCQGKYFEMFAITADNTIAGSVSLYEHSKSVASVGVEIYPDQRRNGYAAEGMRLIMNHARDLGYRIIQDQVRTDNQASIALHNSLGFETDGYVFRNAKDKDVLLWLFSL